MQHDQPMHVCLLLQDSNKFESENLQYYLEKNLDAREKELERQAELDDKAPKLKAKSKMSKVNFCETHG